MSSEGEASLRRRPLLAIPGWLLLGCLFLPTLEVCGDPMLPLQFPPSYAVYLGGLVVALLGGARLLRSRRRALIALMTLWTLTLFGILTAFAAGAMHAAALLVAGLFLWVQIALTRSMARTAWTEQAIAIGCLVHAIAATGWSALLAFSPDGLWGAYVAFGAGLVMIVASSGMLADAREAAARRRAEIEPAPLPEARAILRD